MFIILTSTIQEATSKWSAPKISEQLIVDIGYQDMEAMRVLYEETNSAIYGFAYSILKNPQDAQDVLQDTFLHIHSYAARYKCQGKPMAWILKITRNLALMKIRDMKKTDYLDGEENYTDFSSYCFTEQSEDRMILEKVLLGLGEEDRQILVLHAISGLKHREIAVIMDMNLSTVLSRYNRTIKKVRKILTEVESHDE